MPGNARLTFLLAVSSAAISVHAEVTIRDPGSFVVDTANLIDADTERQMEGWLRELEQKTTTQVKVLTVETTDGEPFFDFVQRHAELWELGQKGKDNGVLVAISLKERSDRIHVGYGLEGILPDGWCGSLRRKVMVPRFKKGQFGQGLLEATVAIANKIADDANVSLTGIPQYRYRYRQSRVRGGGLACGGLLPFIVLMLIVSSINRRRRYHGRWGGGGFWQAMMIGSMLSHLGGGRRGGWGGGGGGGFGGFGGGSFGGGGGFGGGGAGGSW